VSQLFDDGSRQLFTSNAVLLGVYGGQSIASRKAYTRLLINHPKHNQEINFQEDSGFLVAIARRQEGEFPMIQNSHPSCPCMYGQVLIAPGQY
jgi:hypothetical protein